MTDRENQLRLDELAVRHAWAVEASDLDAMDALWLEAAADPDLADALTEIDAELAAENARDAAAAVAEVAEHLRTHPPRGLTAGDLAANDRLRAAADRSRTTSGCRRWSAGAGGTARSRRRTGRRSGRPS